MFGVNAFKPVLFHNVRIYRIHHHVVAERLDIEPMPTVFAIRTKNQRYISARWRCWKTFQL